MRTYTLLLIAALSFTATAAAQEPVFSGPQVGEELPPLEFQGVYGEHSGKKIDFSARAKGRPVMLIFVHAFNEPTVAMAMWLSEYAATRKPEELATGVVWLTGDVSETEARLKRFRRPWPANTICGISTEGVEGPGRYGLNRQVQVTVLIAKENKVAANFALVQPSLRADFVKITAALVKEIGGKAPTLDDILARGRRRRQAAEAMERFLAKVASEGIGQAAADLQRFAKENAEIRPELGRMARRIVERKIFTESSQAHRYLSRWARQFAPEQEQR